MIYFVDEDIYQTRPFRCALELRGHEVHDIDNADDGLAALLAMTSEDRAIIDIMLGTKESSASAFSREATEDFIKTGLVLVERVLSERGSEFAKQLIFFSNASNSNGLLRDASLRANRYGIVLLSKRDFGSPRAFVERLSGIGFLPISTQSGGGQ